MKILHSRNGNSALKNRNYALRKENFPSVIRSLLFPDFSRQIGQFCTILCCHAQVENLREIPWSRNHGILKGLIKVQAESTSPNYIQICLPDWSEVEWLKKPLSVYCLNIMSSLESNQDILPSSTPPPHFLSRYLVVGTPGIAVTSATGMHNTVAGSPVAPDGSREPCHVPWSSQSA